MKLRKYPQPRYTANQINQVLAYSEEDLRFAEQDNMYSSAFQTASPDRTYVNIWPEQPEPKINQVHQEAANNVGAFTLGSTAVGTQGGYQGAVLGASVGAAVGFYTECWNSCHQYDTQTQWQKVEGH